ncbi:MAG: Fe2+-dependent dioxygenase [Pseudomonadota bacterium]
MLVEIKNLLNPDHLAAVQSVLNQSEFVSGQSTAGSSAKQVKENQEINADASVLEALNNVVMTQLVQHPHYLQTAFPARIGLPIYARYTEGMHYGWHIDDPVMGGVQSRYRADISVTVFLNDPSDYAGGELSIETEFGIRDIKLPAGQAILYPASSRHSVKPVMSGQRLVAITWIQSLLRNPQHRQILSDLAAARNQLNPQHDALAIQKIDNSYNNLFRLWAEV